MKTMSVEDLSRLGKLLWNYRHALDRLEFCLETQVRFMNEGDDRWGSHVADLIEDVADRIGLLDLERSVLLGDQPLPLSDLAPTLPEPWPPIIVEHEYELQSTVDRIQRLVAHHQLALEEHRASLDRLSELIVPTTTSRTYDRLGRTQSSSDRNAVLFDGRM